MLVCLECFPQSYSQLAVNSYFKNILWDQYFNDFILKSTVDYLQAPWGNVFPKAAYIDNDIFILNGLANAKMFTQNEIMGKELSYMVGTSFFNYIPADSVLTVKAFYKNRILYTLDLSRKDRASTIKFVLPDNKSNLLLSFDQWGNLVSSVKNNNGKVVQTSTEKQSNTLSVASTMDVDKNYVLVEESHFDKGLLKSRKMFRENEKNRKRKFQAAFAYLYQGADISKIQTLNKKNKPVSELDFIRINDTLYSIRNLARKGEPYMVFYEYAGDKVTKKSINNSLYYVEIEYTYANNKVAGMTYHDFIEEKAAKYEFGYNITGDLVSVVFKDLNYLSEFVFKRQVMFAYDDKRNIKSLKVVDKNGVIEDEVAFESDFK